MEGVDHSTVARGRLAVLSAHLSASFDQSGAGILECSGCSAVVAPPPYLKGSLTLIDERTGNKYQVQVSEEGTIKATDLKKVFTILKLHSFYFRSHYDWREAYQCESLLHLLRTEFLPPKFLKILFPEEFGSLCVCERYVSNG